MSETLAKPVPALAEIEAAAAAQESRSRAIDMAIRALGAGNDAPLVLQLVAEGLEEDGRAWDAAGLAQKAARLAPDDFSAWLRLGRLQRKIRQWRDARESAERAVAIDPSSVDARMLYAAALFDLSDFDEAKREAEEAARLRPEAAEPLATLARVNVRLSKFEEARDFAQRALALEPHHAGAGIALASADFAQGHPGRAAERCRTLLQRLEIPDQARAEILSVLGDSMDALLRHQDAFAFYQASNHLMEKAAGQSGSENSRRAVDHAGMIENYFRGASLAQWRERPGGDRANFGVAGHAFLVGFPRSGTTLLESALDRHPSIVALAETDALRMCAGDLMADEDALGRLVRLDEKAIRECRSIYWNRAAALLDEPIHGKTIVDKLPIGTVALPVISKLFPEARIIFALRDPRDVVFSCFRRLFGANEVMYELLTLERAANYYDQVMRLADLCGRRLPLEVLTVRNEDVVSDFDGELGRTLNFLELEFDPVVRDFAARGSLARTPSAAQLAQGLNDRGIGAWKRYARWMRPILPILEPWVRRYGYAPTDPALLPAAASPELISIRAAVGGSIGAGRWREAFSAVDDAFAKGFSDPLFHRLRGVRRQQEGDPAGAIEDLEFALGDAPGEVALLSALGLCLARMGRNAEALAHLDDAAALDPHFAPVQFNRGFALENLGELAAAASAYQFALALEPRHAPALGALASLAARRGDWAEARRHAAEALAIAPALPAASLALAQAEIAEGAAAEAERRLTTLAASPGTGAHERALAERLRGDALDRLGRFGEAFAAYSRGAAGIGQVHGPRFAALGAERTSNIIARLSAYFEAADSGLWRRGEPGFNPAPTFVLGFPRSGTTLLSQALALNPTLFTLDEADLLSQEVATFFADVAALERLARLSTKEADEAASRYLVRARRAGWPDDGRRLVDKLPMNTLALPILSRLFPAAKIVFLRRDPRDVVLSCFRRPLAINPTTIDFLDLSNAARLYAATMDLFEIYREKLELDLRIQAFEALLADFEGETRAICEFLGTPWSEAMGGFAARAGEVATPSSAQLAGGLSGEGVGAWRNYKPQIARALPILSPWVEKFAYPPD